MKPSTTLTCSLALFVSCGLQISSEGETTSSSHSSFFSTSSDSDAVKGSGVVIEETRDVAPFDSIKVGGSMNVILSQGEPGPLRIKAEDNLAPLVVATVSGSELTLRTTGSYSTKVGITVYVTTADIRSITAGGSTDVLCQGRFEVDELELDASGSSDIECAVKAGSLTVVTSGSSDIRLSGNVDHLEVVASGSSDVAAFELVAAKADVKASGSSDASVNAKVLRAHASGSSDIRYRGLPEELTSSDSGAGSVGPEGT